MTKLRRTRSVGRFDHTPWGMPWDDGAAGDEDWESPTAHVIRMAGYPLQTYTVVTEDGYILGMERIPRPGAPDVALFMHGILDTSLTWVSSGVTGSQAFAAWDQGFDVWLGSSRSNPPRAATNPEHQGMGYWQYTMNELGIYDVAAQVDKLHEVKLQELGGRDPRLDLRYAAGDPASAFRGAVSPVRRGAAATDGGTCFLLGGGAAASGRPAAPSGEALFSGSGVSAAPAPAAPRVVAPRGPLRMQRSYSDQALAPLGAPHGSSMPLAGGGSVAGDAAEAAAAAARLGRGGGADAGVAERRRRGLRAWLRSRSGKPAPAGREAGGVGAAAGVNGGDGVGGAAEEAKWAARAGGGRGGSKSRWPWSRQEQPQPLKDDDRRAHGAVRDDAGRKGVPTPPCQPGTPDASEHPPPSLGPAAARAGPRRAGGDQEGERPQRAWFNPGGQGAEDQPSRGGCAPPSPPASPVAGYAAQQAAATSAADGPAAPYAAATAAGATAADGVAVPALSVSSSLGSSGAGAGQDGGTPTPSSGAAGRAAVAAAPAAVPAAAAAAAAGGAEAPLSGIRRAQSSQAIFSLARSGPRGAGGSSSASLQQLLARGQAGGAPAPSAKAAAGSQGVVGSGALLGGATQAEEAGRAAPPAAGQQGAVGPSACVPRRAHGGGRDPYNLRVVAHSLGCASMLIYLVMRLRSGRPHHLQRLVLLSPAGFHAAVPWVFRPVLRMVPPFMFLMRMLLGARAAAALYIPTSAARLLTFKFMLDFARLPALGDLMRAFMRFSLNGDRSQWDRAMQLPHYNARAMPAVSFHQGLHFVQMYRSGRFRLYDYGSKAENMAHYGHPAPPDIASEYWRLDIPVDICAGVHDGVIPPKNVRCHVAAMRAAGVDVSYREFDYGHIDFTMATRDELRYWVLAKLGRR